MSEGQGGGGRNPGDPLSRLHRMMDQMFGGGRDVFRNGPFSGSPFFNNDTNLFGDPFFRMPRAQVEFSPRPSHQGMTACVALATHVRL